MFKHNFFLGIAAHRVEHCVQWIKRGIEKFQQTDPMYLRTIKVVIFDHKHVSKFQSLQTKKEESSPSQKTSPLNKALPSAGILSPASSESFSSDRREIFRLVFCSKSKEINAKVKLKEILRNTCIETRFISSCKFFFSVFRLKTLSRLIKSYFLLKSKQKIYNKYKVFSKEITM